MKLRIAFFGLIILLNLHGTYAQDVYNRTVKLMGSRFDIMVVADNSKQADSYIDLAIEEISRIERLISSWNPDSETSQINRYAGIKPVRVSKELYDLIKRSIIISELTDGAFDITFASMDKIWRFDGTMTRMPPKKVIKKSIKKVGYKKIILNDDNQTVFLPKKGMKIGFGAIGKGYAADKAKALLISKGVQAGIINASGDLNTWGTWPSGKPWTVVITNPMDKTKFFGMFDISNRAVVTSGNYEKFVELDGIRYSHIINPKTGYPTTGILSVTVFAPKAELADALATAVFVMGIDVGMDRIEQLPQVDCLIVDENGKVYKSKNIHIITKKIKNQ